MTAVYTTLEPMGKSNIEFQYIEDYWILGEAYKNYDQNVENDFVENCLMDTINAAMAIDCLLSNQEITLYTDVIVRSNLPKIIMEIGPGFHINKKYLEDVVCEPYSYQQPPYIESAEKEICGKNYSSIQLVFPNNFRILDRLSDLFNPLMWEFYNKPIQEFWWEEVVFMWWWHCVSFLDYNMKRASELLYPEDIGGSNKVRNPRSFEGLPDVKFLYTREDGKPPRDGAGRISPGLWVPSVHSNNNAVCYEGSEMYQFALDNKLASKFVKSCTSGKIKVDKEPPFDEADYDNAEKMLLKTLNMPGSEWDDLRKVQPGQPFRLNRIEGFAKIIDDPDIKLIKNLSEGVKMGDDSSILEVGLWPDKIESNFVPEAEYVQWGSSYISAESNPSQV